MRTTTATNTLHCDDLELPLFARAAGRSFVWTYERAPQSVPGCACLYALWHLGQWCLECDRRCPRRLKRWHERAQQHGHRTLQADVRSWSGGGASSNGWFVSWHSRATPIGGGRRELRDVAVDSRRARRRVCLRTCRRRCCRWRTCLLHPLGSMCSGRRGSRTGSRRLARCRLSPS